MPATRTVVAALAALVAVCMIGGLRRLHDAHLAAVLAERSTSSPRSAIATEILGRPPAEQAAGVAGPGPARAGGEPRPAAPTWIDHDTAPADRRTTFADDPDRAARLVFSDEFNLDGRDFKDGSDPRWTAIHKDDYTNAALHFYNENMASTNGGHLNLTTLRQDSSWTYLDDKTQTLKKVKKNYQSSMVQGWNKFCFTGGIVEVRAQLPGKAKTGGLWPAFWMMGNLARATYTATSDWMWPWSYEKGCDRAQQKHQKISPCTRTAHYGFHPFQGRGAPEIDILEVMPGSENLKGTPINKPYLSSSLQISPGVQHNRPASGEAPKTKGSWYEGMSYGNSSDANIFFYGAEMVHKPAEYSYYSDAISANTQLDDSHFDDFQTYRLEWMPGAGGHIRWYLNGELLFEIEADVLDLTGANIPNEPMYLLMNTAMSSTWGFPVVCPKGCSCKSFDCTKRPDQCALPPGLCQNLPAHFLIDWIRVYQPEGDKRMSVGCETKEHPSKKWIQGHPKWYAAPGSKIPMLDVADGGGKCKADAQCGGGARGACTAQGTCACAPDWTGPNCKAQAVPPDEAADLGWVEDLRALLAGRPDLYLPSNMVATLALLLGAAVATVCYTQGQGRADDARWNGRRARESGADQRVGRPTERTPLATGARR